MKHNHKIILDTARDEYYDGYDGWGGLYSDLYHSRTAVSTKKDTKVTPDFKICPAEVLKKEDEHERNSGLRKE